MERYAAFLRGVNLGPHRRVSGADLRACVMQLGFAEAATFRASGNVVFAAERQPEERLVARLEEGIAAAFGFETRVFVRASAEVRAIAAHEPFPAADVAASAGKLQVSLLPRVPSAEATAKALALATDEDRLAIRDRELYWLPSGGQLESALDLQALERLLGPTTRRTKGTMELLVEKLFAG